MLCFYRINVLIVILIFSDGTYQNYPPEHEDIKFFWELFDFEDLLKHETVCLGHLLYKLIMQRGIWDNIVIRHGKEFVRDYVSIFQPSC